MTYIHFFKTNSDDSQHLTSNQIHVCMYTHVCTVTPQV